MGDFSEENIMNLEVIALKLSDEAQDDRDRFNHYHADSGCTCFTNPPCSWCTHPGNPLNQEDDEFWVEDKDFRAIKSIRAVKDKPKNKLFGSW